MKSSGTQGSEPRAAFSRTARRWYWMPAMVLALGVASILMLVATNLLRERLVAQDVALVHSLGEIETGTSISHLWMEEYVTGDDVAQGEIWNNLSESLDLVEKMLNGGATSRQRLQFRPLRDPELRRQAERLRGLIQEFEEISRRRNTGYEQGADVGIGSAMDIEYDAIFGRLLGQARDLELVLDERRRDNLRRSNLLFRSILVAWSVIVLLAATGLWTRERRRVRAEEALRQSEEQLLQAQKMEAVGRLAGGLAHDINNYLAAITSQCELVKLKAEPEGRVAGKMDAVIATVFKASELIKRLLAFSRKQPVDPQAVDLNSVIEGLEKMMPRLIGEDLRLETDLHPQLWNLSADPSQMEQIVVNLVINAREAMPTGGRVMIETANSRFEEDSFEGPLRAEPGEYVMLGVSDTGEGIREEIRSKIFEPFFTTKDGTGSSGLGLATVYAIVEESGGQIGVDSEPGVGTAVRIYLPRSEAPAKSVAEETEAVSVRTKGSERILLVEDNDDLRESTSSVLAELGYEVTVAATGEEALRGFSHEGWQVDLLITDVVLPGISGKELVDRLEIGDRPRVIFVSGYFDDVMLRHGVREGEVDFLQKPFALGALTAKVREVLDRVDPIPA